MRGFQVDSDTAQLPAVQLLKPAVARFLAAALCIVITLPALADVPPADSTVPTFALPGMDGSKIPLPTAPARVPDLTDLTDEERLTVAIFDRNTPSVVNIANLAAYSRKCASVQPPSVTEMACH